MPTVRVSKFDRSNVRDSRTRLHGCADRRQRRSGVDCSHYQRRPLFLGTFIVAVFIGLAYIAFQLAFGFRIDSAALGTCVFIVMFFVAPVYFFGPFDRSQYQTEIQFKGVWEKAGPVKSDIDLLNLETIYASGRNGLNLSLVWFIAIAIASFLIMPVLGNGLWVVLPMIASSVAVGLMFLLAPAHKVRRMIREVKHEELMRLDPILRQARDDALTNDVNRTGRLADLLAYKTQVESTPEWPFDSSTLLRFGLYLLIPVVPMIGGVLVERIVDFLLD